MNDFTASNGIRIRKAALSWVYAAGGSDYFAEINGFTVDSPLERAMREFFQAEANESLGIWRSSDDPDVMVFKIDDDTIRLLHLRNRGVSTTFARYDQDGKGPLSAIARAYFDAHPEPKPLPTVEGVYAMRPRVHLYERLIMLRGGQWLNLYTSADEFAEGISAEQVARTAVDEGRLTLLTPEVS